MTNLRERRILVNGPAVSAAAYSCTPRDHVAVILARAYLRLLSHRHNSPSVGQLCGSPETSQSPQIQVDRSARPIAVQTLTGAQTLPSKEQ